MLNRFQKFIAGAALVACVLGSSTSLESSKLALEEKNHVESISPWAFGLFASPMLHEFDGRFETDFQQSFGLGSQAIYHFNSNWAFAFSANFFNAGFTANVIKSTFGTGLLSQDEQWYRVDYLSEVIKSFDFYADVDLYGASMRYYYTDLMPEVLRWKRFASYMALGVDYYRFRNVYTQYDQERPQRFSDRGEWGLSFETGHEFKFDDHVYLNYGVILRSLDAAEPYYPELSSILSFSGFFFGLGIRL